MLKILYDPHEDNKMFLSDKNDEEERRRLDDLKVAVFLFFFGESFWECFVSFFFGLSKKVQILAGMNRRIKWLLITD